MRIVHHERSSFSTSTTRVNCSQQCSPQSRSLSLSAYSFSPLHRLVGPHLQHHSIRLHQLDPGSACQNPATQTLRNNPASSGQPRHLHLQLYPTRPHKLRRESPPRHRLHARSQTKLSSPSSWALGLVGSVRRLGIFYHYTCVQSGMVAPDKPPIRHAVAFWFSQHALYSLSVTASWDVYAMGH